MKKINNVFIALVIFIVLTLISYADFKEIMKFDLSYISLFLISILWNLGPIVCFYLLLRKGLPFLKFNYLTITLLISGIGLVLVPVGWYLIMIYERIFGGGNSTSALGFVFVPIYAMLLGLIPGILYLLRLEKHY